MAKATLRHVPRIPRHGHVIIVRTAAALLLSSLSSCAAKSHPSVYWTSSPVRPGQTALIVGGGLVGCSSVQISSANGGAVLSAKTVIDSGHAIAFTLPEAVDRGMLRVRLATNRGMTEVLLNRPKIWWVQELPVSESPGRILEVFGTCLNGPARIDGLPVHSTSRSDYARIIPLPENIVPGWHSVTVGAGRPVRFRMTTKSGEGGSPHIFLYPSPGDDTSIIEKVLGDLSRADGGTLILKPGTYHFGAEIRIPAHIVLRGSGKTNTVLSWSDSKNPPTALIRGSGYFTVENMTLRVRNCHNGIESDHDPAWTTANSHAPGHITIRNINLRMAPFMGNLTRQQIAQHQNIQEPTQRGNAAIYLGGPDVDITHCNVYAAHMGLYLVNCTNSLVADNRVYLGRYGWDDFEGCRRIVITHNVIRGGSALASGAIVLSCYSHDISEDVYCAFNRITRLYGGDREGIVSDGGGGEYTGYISAAHNNIVRLAVPPNSNPKWGPRLGKSCALFIINGRGMGQYRRVMHISGRNITLQRAFSVQPNRTSIVSLTALQRNYIFFRNTIKHAGSGIEFFAGAVNCVAADNIAISTQRGFWNVGQPYGGYIQPSWYIQWLRNRSDGIGTQLGIYGGCWFDPAEPTTLGCIARDNVFDHGKIVLGGLGRPGIIHPSFPYTRYIIVEGNTIVGGRNGLTIARGTSQVILAKNRSPPKSK